MEEDELISDRGEEEVGRQRAHSEQGSDRAFFLPPGSGSRGDGTGEETGDAGRASKEAEAVETQL